jgi:IclR family transcriptional regulator, pca regulon regulatory protein
MRRDEDARGQPRSFPTLPEPRYSRSLERGLAILACFTPERPVLGVAEIAEELGMSRPTTHRYVSTLVAQGYLSRDASRKYRLALGAVDLGMSTLNAMGLCNHARPDLRELARRSGHTVEMAVLDGLEILLLDSVRPPRGERAKSDDETQRGTRLPAYCTSMGKVLLAHLPARRLSRLIPELDLVGHGPKTITSQAALRRQLEEVVREGFAVNDEELSAGACAIAAPVRDASGDVVAAVNVSARHGALDVEDLVEWFTGQVLATAERISTRLGWSLPAPE